MVTVTTNIGLDDDATGLQTSSVGEPSVAASTSTVFMTGNWYASRSGDRGADGFVECSGTHTDGSVLVMRSPMRRATITRTTAY